MPRRSQVFLLNSIAYTLLPLHVLTAQQNTPLHTQGNTTTPIFIVIIGLLLSLIVYLFLQIKKQKHHTLSRGEQFYKQILDVDQEGYLGIDSRGILIDVNDAYCRMSGYTKRELLGMHIKQLEGTESPSEIAIHFERIIKKQYESFTSMHKKKNGEVYPVELSATVVDYEPLFLVCFIQDITQQKKAETALNETTDLMRYVIEHSRSAIAIHDRDMCYLYVSKKYTEEYKISDPDIIGKNHYDVFPDLPQKWRDVHVRCLAGEVLSAEDDVYERSDGNVEWTRWECRPWYTSSEEIGGVIVYTEVITERKRFEIELRRTKEFLEKLINYANAPIVVWDDEYHITRFNHAFEVLVGRTQQEVLNQPLLTLFPPEQREEALRRIEELTNTMQSEGNELQIMHKNGTIRTLLWNSAVVLDEQGNKKIATIAQGQDITSRKLAESKVAEQLQELQRWYKVMSTRESRIIELKGEINRLLILSHQEPIYTSPLKEDG